jgi:hypothetical protein
MVAQGHRNFAATKASIREADAAIRRAPQGMLETEHHLVKVIEDAGYENFVFVLFRTDFTSESRWECFLEKWDVLLDISLMRHYRTLDCRGFRRWLRRLWAINVCAEWNLRTWLCMFAPASVLQFL